MTGRSFKTCIYLAAFVVALIMLLVGIGAGTKAILAAGGVGALVFVAALATERSSRNQYRGLIAFAVLGLLFFGLGFLLSGGTEGGLVDGLKNALSKRPIWLGIPVTLFAGFCLLSLTNSHLAGYRVVSMPPDLALGTGLALAFYSFLHLLSDQNSTAEPSGLFSAFLGTTIIHYLIVLMFFITVSYIGRVFVGLWLRGRAIACGDGDASIGHPKEITLRRFMRVVIGTLPLLGFLGTVLGITQALAGLPSLFSGGGDLQADVSSALSASLASIAVAFETTMLGLVGSLVASLTLSYAEKVESDLETAENEATGA